MIDRDCLPPEIMRIVGCEVGPHLGIVSNFHQSRLSPLETQFIKMSPVAGENGGQIHGPERVGLGQLKDSHLDEWGEEWRLL